MIRFTRPNLIELIHYQGLAEGIFEDDANPDRAQLFNQEEEKLTKILRQIYTTDD